METDIHENKVYEPNIEMPSNAVFGQLTTTLSEGYRSFLRVLSQFESEGDLDCMTLLVKSVSCEIISQATRDELQQFASQLTRLVNILATRDAAPSSTSRS